ncbi:hypothetical protein BpHYR1_040273 [Brachionus plicatilis]|uniref:Uncharacterized protein n=1 Tax=Brachionus plicatilis TaxID=10195 RepID=A0A3M7R823_BRAPC|nr:hypothetical protein BpHYR1_040273 [Brachionus plicatilis]
MCTGEVVCCRRAGSIRLKERATRDCSTRLDMSERPSVPCGRCFAIRAIKDFVTLIEARVGVLNHVDYQVIGVEQSVLERVEHIYLLVVLEPFDCESGGGVGGTL